MDIPWRADSLSFEVSRIHSQSPESEKFSEDRPSYLPTEISDLTWVTDINRAEPVGKLLNQPSVSVKSNSFFAVSNEKNSISEGESKGKEAELNGDRMTIKWYATYDDPSFQVLLRCSNRNLCSEYRYGVVDGTPYVLCAGVEKRVKNAAGNSQAANSSNAKQLLHRAFEQSGHHPLDKMHMVDKLEESWEWVHDRMMINFRSD
jgi:hypothetical protein